MRGLSPLAVIVTQIRGSITAVCFQGKFLALWIPQIWNGLVVRAPSRVVKI